MRVNVLMVLVQMTLCDMRGSTSATFELKHETLDTILNGPSKTADQLVSVAAECDDRPSAQCARIRPQRAWFADGPRELPSYRMCRRPVTGS